MRFLQPEKSTRKCNFSNKVTSMWRYLNLLFVIQFCNLMQGWSNWDFIKFIWWKVFFFHWKWVHWMHFLLLKIWQTHLYWQWLCKFLWLIFQICTLSGSQSVSNEGYELGEFLSLENSYYFLNVFRGWSSSI